MSVGYSHCGRRTSLVAGQARHLPPCRQYTRTGPEIPPSPRWAWSIIVPACALLAEMKWKMYVSNLTENPSKKCVTKIWQPLAEVLLWGAVGLAMACCLLAFRPALLSHDSYQYLSVAANIRNGNGISTDLVHYDTERSHGRIPAPLTTFPPGYPAAIAMLSFFGGSFESTARVLSAVSFAGTAFLLALILIAARVNALVRCAALLLLITNAVSDSFSTAVLSDSFFVFLFTAAIAALIWAWWGAKHPRAQLLWTIAGLTLAGLSYWVRYAGLFLIVALILFVVLRYLRLQHRAGISEFYAALIPLGLAGILMARNVLLVGTWRGGNDIQVFHSIRDGLADYARAQRHFLFGEHAVHLGVWEALLLAGIVGLSALIGRVLLRVESGASSILPRSLALWTLPFICAAVYSAGLCYAGLRTVISFETRYFSPVMPLYLLLFGLVAHWIFAHVRFSGEKFWLRVALCALTIGSAGVNARDMNTPLPQPEQNSLFDLFAERTADGPSLSEWVNVHLAPGTVIAAQDGQATGYFLHRRTLSLIGSGNSAERWECPEIRTQMNRFGARYLILYRHPGYGSLLEESSFAATAVLAEPGCGFDVAAETPDVRILEMGPFEGSANILPR